MAQPGWNLTSRDRAILDVVTQRVRVLSTSQVSRTWFAKTRDPVRAAQRRLLQLEALGLVERFTAAARPELLLEAPLVQWRPDETAPEFDRLSYLLARRWNKPAVPTSMVVASRQGGIWLGGAGGRRPRRSEVSHDLSLAGLYLGLLDRHPKLACSWKGEAQIRKLGYGDRAKLPDAMITRNGVLVALELGGAYSAGKLREFHRFCKDQGLAYDLW